MRFNFRVIVCFAVLLGLLFSGACFGKELSVLERVNTVEDRELGELIRIALDNLPETSAIKRWSAQKTRDANYNNQGIKLKNAEEKARALAVKSVTEAYSQIKLLDTQIEQAKKKMERLTKSDAIFMELTLAIAELENKQNKQLAELRQIMNVVPNYAFGHKSAKTLNGWLELDVIDDKVYVFKCLKPFREVESLRSNPRYIRLGGTKSELIKPMTRTETLKYITSYIKDKNMRPFRIDVMSNDKGRELSRELYDDIINTLRVNRLGLESVVYLHSNTHNVYHNSYYVHNGKIHYYGYRGKYQLLQGGEQEHINNVVEMLNNPEFVPLKLKYELHEDSIDLYNRVHKKVLLKAKEMGMEDVVETEKVLKYWVLALVTQDDILMFFNDEDHRLKQNAISYDHFIKKVMPEQLKRSKDFPIYYRVQVSGSSEFYNQMIKEMMGVIKKAGVEERVKVNP